MGTVAEHYEQLLADHYTWMFGEYDVKVAEQRALLERLGVVPGSIGSAVDLGCGSGFQSIALAELGCAVTAVDLSQQLLAEMMTHAGDWQITPRQADISAFAKQVTTESDLIVCMGDTLTHLDSADRVSTLFVDVARMLKPDGRFIISYRDLTIPLEGLDRFIPVRQDADKVLLCFLEYAPETVIVHDILQQRIDGQWTLSKSWYRKLRLGTGWVVAQLEATGLMVHQQEVVKGMTMIVAAK